ncbi:MAG TPA: hypothetical protein ENI15_17145 [Spirochaetes bacterium]|nr:hypothetical protein [Spirochaetota bacterium]
MMKTISLVGLLLLVLMLVSTQAMAVGIGIYGGLGKASNARVRNADLKPTAATEESHMLAGLGFVLDTAVAKNQLFNYRLNIGFEKWNWGDDTLQNITTAEPLRFGIYNTFGFGIIRTRLIRFWLGPQLGLTLFTEPATKTGTFLDLFQLTDNNGAFGSTLGLATGVNINIGEKFTVSIDGGARRWTYRYLNANPTQLGERRARTHEYYGNVSVMFRINDVYQKK